MKFIILHLNICKDTAIIVVVVYCILINLFWCQEGVRVAQLEETLAVNQAVGSSNPGCAKLTKKAFSKLSTLKCWVFRIET